MLFTFKVCFERDLNPKAYFRRLFVFWPGAKWNLDILDCNINKPCVFHTLSLKIIFKDLEYSAHFLTSLPKDGMILTQGTSIFNCAIITMEIGARNHTFDISTLLKTTESITEQGMPIGYNTNQHTRVNETEGNFIPGPLLIAVIDLEVEVRRNPRRLDWGHVGSDYFGVGKVVGKVTVSWLRLVN